MPTETYPLVAEDIPKEETNALLDRLAQGIVRRRLTAPALFALEMCKPLNFVGSQVMIALNPFVAAFFNATDYRKVALLLERDENLERLLRRIEELDAREQENDRRIRKEPGAISQAENNCSHDEHVERIHPLRAFLARLRRRRT